VWCASFRVNWFAIIVDRDRPGINEEATATDGAPMITDEKVQKKS
jgi:hypothetical protein